MKDAVDDKKNPIPGIDGLPIRVNKEIYDLKEDGSYRWYEAKPCEKSESGLIFDKNPVLKSSDGQGHNYWLILQPQTTVNLLERKEHPERR